MFGLIKPRDHVGALIEDAAGRFGTAPFLRTSAGSLSYAELEARCCQVANGLAELGVRSGDRVAIMMDNRAEYLLAWFGINKLGAIEVSINTAFKGTILAYLLENSGSSCIVIERAYLEVLAAQLGALPQLKHIVVVDSAAQVPVTGRTVTRFESFSGCASTFAPKSAPTEVSLLGYTSGTTGPSKGAMIPHNRIIKSGEDMMKLRQITPQDNLYTCLPLFHGNAKLLTVIPAITAGCRVSVGLRFSVSGFWDEVRACGATQINYLGVMIAMLHAQAAGPDDRRHSVRLGWGAGAPAAIHRSFEERFGMRLLEGFGLTEGGIPLSNTLAENRPGSCGKPLPGYECDVVDEWDNPVPAGKEGEIVFRPLRPYTTMLGYYNMPEKTVDIYRNCMLHTGDLARKDADGFFFFVDRKKDAIRRRGENISSFEVEAAINAHPKVLESAAFAVPSDVSEDDVMAVIVLREGQTASAEELTDHCIENMPYFWVPRYLRITHEGLPRTPTNKVTKFTLREQGVASASWDRQKAAYRLDAPRTPKRTART